MHAHPHLISVSSSSLSGAGVKFDSDGRLSENGTPRLTHLAAGSVAYSARVKAFRARNWHKWCRKQREKERGRPKRVKCFDMILCGVYRIRRITCNGDEALTLQAYAHNPPRTIAYLEFDYLIPGHPATMA